VPMPVPQLPLQEMLPKREPPKQVLTAQVPPSPPPKLLHGNTAEAGASQESPTAVRERTPFLLSACTPRTPGQDAGAAGGAPCPKCFIWGCSLGALVVISALAVVSVCTKVPFFRADWLAEHGMGVQPTPDMCNKEAPIPPVEEPRIWRPSAYWRRTCEAKNRHRFWWQFPEERNWCWIGFKAKCHANLKAHRSWADIQAMAARDGISASRASSPFDPLERPEICDQPANGKTRKWTPKEQEAAHKWFRSHVQVYVLNMISDTERWTMIKNRLADLKIPASRVLGVDMRTPNALQTATLAGWVKQGYNFSDAQRTAFTKKHNMGSILGTLGCASAHFKAQRKVLEDGSPLAVVLEDDSWPVEDFVERLWSLVLEELPCDWEVASLMSRCPFGKCVSRHLSRVQPDRNEPAWRCHQGVNWGMQGVLYRTSALEQVQRLWQDAVFNEERPHCMDVDVALASISDRVSFYAVPAGQDPGFLKETNHKSARWSINMASKTKTREPFLLDQNNMG